MGDIRWTKSQRAAIDIVDRSVLVSAGAGSGKTAVLAERCAHLVLDSDPPCDIDQLLVVTFTEAAAGEMRERIGRSLRQRQADRPNDPRIRRQIAFLDTAKISTIHSFCRSVLNRYFAQADLDPQAPILDPHEAGILKRETVKKIFDNYAVRTDAEGDRFLDFLAAYGNAEDRLQESILDLNEFLASLPDPDDWLDSVLGNLECPSETEPPPYWAAELRNSLTTELKAQFEAVSQEIQALLRRFGNDPNELKILAPFVECLTHYEESLESWMTQLQRSAEVWTLDGVCKEGMGVYEFPAIPRKVKKVYDALPAREAQAFDEGQETVRGVRDNLLKKLQERWTAFDSAGWAAGIRHIFPSMTLLVQLLRETRDAYQSAKGDLGVIDFGDLETFTLKILRDESNGVASRLRDEIRHVLVDEFQDVNPIQAEIIRRVSREADDARADNLFTVGDVKQSIYRFRLAEPKLFLDRQAAFQMQNDPAAIANSESPAVRGQAIDLLENFRSTRPMIDAVNAVFEKLMARDLGGIDYDEHARLKFPSLGSNSTQEAHKANASVGALPAEFPPIEIYVLEDDSRASAASTHEPAGDNDESDDLERIEREAYAIATRIKQLVADGYKYGDMVILLRSMKARIELFIRALSALDIPVFADSSGGLFDSIEISDVLALLSVLDNSQQDIPLAAVLRSPLLGMPMSDTQLALIRCAGGESSKYEPFHAAVRQYAADGSDDAIRELLCSKLRAIGAWRHRIRRRPIADVLWDIYVETGYFSFVSGLKNGEQRRANLIQLHEHARKFGEFQRQGLLRFLQFLDGIQNAGGDLDAGSIAPPSGDVVRIMTIHRSKGLEFPVVFLGELGKRFNIRDSAGSILYDRKLGIALEAVDIDKRIVYPTLPHRLVAQANRFEAMAEDLRVLYVAMTRAKQKLILVGTGTDQMILGTDAPTSGPLPLLRRRRATCMLDWVFDAINAQGRSSIGASLDGAESRLFAAFHYGAEEMQSWQIDPPRNQAVAEKLSAIARMQPLPTSAKSDESLAIVERRLTTPYAAAALSHVPAVVAASILKRRWNTLDDETEPAATLPIEIVDANTASMQANGRKRKAEFSFSASDFRVPEFVNSDSSPTATRRGTLTHEFLQRVDLRLADSQYELKQQLAGFIENEVFTNSDAATINLDAIAWFFETNVGRTLRNPATRILREWPFVLSVDPTKYDAAATAQSADDVLLVRGIIDCLFDTGEGWQVLDYKTDKVSGAAVGERAALYQGQLDIYAAAIEAAFRVRPRANWLIFLDPREIVRM